MSHWGQPARERWRARYSTVVVDAIAKENSYSLIRQGTGPGHKTHQGPVQGVISHHDASWKCTLVPSGVQGTCKSPNDINDKR